jgi:hypothetical protein
MDALLVSKVEEDLPRDVWSTLQSDHEEGVLVHEVTSLLEIFFFLCDLMQLLFSFFPFFIFFCRAKCTFRSPPIRRNRTPLPLSRHQQPRGVSGHCLRPYPRRRLLVSAPWPRGTAPCRMTALSHQAFVTQVRRASPTTML